MGDELEGVCAELDETVLELMNSLQRLAEARKKYGAAVSEGYFNLAKARYSMPPQSVGALQYDSVMTPLVHVETSRESLSSYEEISAAEGLEFAVSRSVTGASEQKKEISDETGQQLRRRRRPAAASGDGDSVEDVSGEAEAKEAGGRQGEGGGRGREKGGGSGQEEGGVKDPLRWFGVLAPHCLRHSQQYFIQAVAHCAEIASLQARVETLRRSYHKLLLEKKELTQTAA